MSGDGRVYPLPARDDDARFSAGLLQDVVKVLVEHGYPPITAGLDLVELRQSLYTFLYAGPNGGEPR